MEEEKENKSEAGGKGVITKVEGYEERRMTGEHDLGFSKNIVIAHRQHALTPDPDGETARLIENCVGQFRLSDSARSVEQDASGQRRSESSHLRRSQQRDFDPIQNLRNLL